MDTLGLGFVKLSFVFFYRRIFAVGNRSQPVNILTILVNTLTVAWTIAYFFAILLGCKGHFRALWKSEKAVMSSCGKIPEILLSLSISDFVMDIVIFVLPVPMV